MFGFVFMNDLDSKFSFSDMACQNAFQELIYGIFVHLLRVRNSICPTIIFVFANFFGLSASNIFMDPWVKYDFNS